MNPITKVTLDYTHNAIHAVPQTPTGLNHSAQGCEERATLGSHQNQISNPERVASVPLDNRHSAPNTFPSAEPERAPISESRNTHHASFEHSLLARMFKCDLEVAQTMCDISHWSRAEAHLKDAIEKIRQLAALPRRSEAEAGQSTDI